MPVRPIHLAPAGLAMALVLAACGGGAASPAATTAPAVSEAPSAESPSAASPSAESPSVESPSAASMAPSGSAASPSASAGQSPPASAEADVMVTAVDYAFEGLPAEVTSGMTLGLTNTGQEVHEMVVFRKPPTTTQSFQELLALPPAEAQTLVENVGFAFAEPGQTAGQVVTIGEPGDYLMVCFVPQGTTALPSIDPNAPEASSLGTGAPHHTLGMLEEFTVAE